MLFVSINNDLLHALMVDYDIGIGMIFTLILNWNWNFISI